MVDGGSVRLTDPDPKAAELLRPKLVDDRPQAVVAAVAAAFAEAQLAEWQREVVGQDQHIRERGVLAGQHLAHGEPRVIHEGERLDQGQVKTPVPAQHHARVVTLPATARPTCTVGDPIDHQPADVVARPGVLRPGVAQADDEFHPLLRTGAVRTRTARQGPIPSGRASADGSSGRPRRTIAATPPWGQGAEPRGRASPPPRPVRHDPSRRCGAHRA